VVVEEVKNLTVTRNPEATDSF